MAPGPAIAKLGFQRWYERQLIESHAWLVTCLLCGFALAATVELVDLQSGFAALPTLGVAFVAGLLAWHALLRYAQMMRQAQRFATQSHCPQCGRYAAFDVVMPAPRIDVRCRHCRAQWRLG